MPVPELKLDTDTGPGSFHFPFCKGPLAPPSLGNAMGSHDADAFIYS